MTRASESCEGWNSHKTRSVYHFQDSCRWKLASTRIGAIVRQGMSGRVKTYQGISRHIRTQCCRCREEREVRCEFAGRKRCVTCSRLTRRDFPRLIGRASARSTSRLVLPSTRHTHTHTHSHALRISVKSRPGRCAPLNTVHTARVIVLYRVSRSRPEFTSKESSHAMDCDRPRHSAIGPSTLELEFPRPADASQGDTARVSYQRLQVTDFRGQ
ncbi:hypothetical protein F5882DRAFT_396362 [Hyaloscypha sp. PMI_1271]|nr:hypothetical protein F5882DRAFT_396362 [Hyaloscypha sp. PMI_1271]